MSHTRNVHGMWRINCILPQKIHSVEYLVQELADSNTAEIIYSFSKSVAKQEKMVYQNCNVFALSINAVVEFSWK